MNSSMFSFIHHWTYPRCFLKVPTHSAMSRCPKPLYYSAKVCNIWDAPKSCSMTPLVVPMVQFIYLVLATHPSLRLDPTRSHLVDFFIIDVWLDGFSHTQTKLIITLWISFTFWWSCSRSSWRRTNMYNYFCIIFWDLNFALLEGFY